MTTTISKGTLNLRFMQNARRAEQEQVDIKIDSVETIIKDESQWEVAKEVRDAWGIGSEPSSSSSVKHETSYLPFVLTHAFDDDDDDGDDDDPSGSLPRPIKLRGRRTWNKRGQEVIEKEIRSQSPRRAQDDDDGSHGSPSARQVPPTEQQRSQEEQYHSTTSKRLTSISSFGPGSSSTKDTKRAKSRRVKSAQEVIREAVPAGVGARVHTNAIKTRTTEKEMDFGGGGDTSSPTIKRERSSLAKREGGDLSHSPLDLFLKPAGVDDPSDYVARGGDGSRSARPPVTTTTTIPQLPPPPPPLAKEGDIERRPNSKRERDDHRETSSGLPTADRKRMKGGAAAGAS